MRTALALATLAAAATAQPLAPVAPAAPAAPAEAADSLTSAEKLKRTTFAIDSIIARSEPICTSSDPNTLCAQQSQALSSIAGTALEGYGTLLARAAPGVKGWKKEKKKKLTKDLEHTATKFKGAPAGDTSVKRRGVEDEDDDDDDVEDDMEWEDSELDKRAPPGVRGWKNQSKKKLTKNLEHTATKFKGAPAGDTSVKRRDVEDEDEIDDDVELDKRAAPGVRGMVKGLSKKKYTKQLEHTADGFKGAPAGDTSVKKRAAPGVRGMVKGLSKKKYTKQFEHIATKFKGAQAGDTSVKAKRYAFPESLIAHCDNDAELCQADERDPEDAYLLSKRDADEGDFAETMQPRGVGETLIAIRDAVDVIKREAAEAGEGDDEVVEGYFEVIDEKIKRAVELLED